MTRFISNSELADQACSTYRSFRSARADIIYFSLTGALLWDEPQLFCFRGSSSQSTDRQPSMAHLELVYEDERGEAVLMVDGYCGLHDRCCATDCLAVLFELMLMASIHLCLRPQAARSQLLRFSGQFRGP
jgi:hypothetical protein